MDRHTPFILASYALTFLVLAGLIGAIIYDHLRLKKSLTRFPAREDGDREA